MPRIRKSVPTKGVSNWWMSGWAYIMPDFDNPGHSIIEWNSDNPPVYAVESNRVPETNQKEGADHGSRP